MDTKEKQSSEKHRDSAKKCIRNILIETAQNRTQIVYSDLARKVNHTLTEKGIPVSFHEPYDDLANVLGEISIAEDDFDHPLISVLVVNKKDRVPGPGFFNMAKGLGHDVSNKESFYLRETARTHDCWKDKAAGGVG